MYGGSSLVEFLAPRPDVINASKLERIHAWRGEVDGLRAQSTTRAASKDHPSGERVPEEAPRCA